MDKIIQALMAKQGADQQGVMGPGNPINDQQAMDYRRRMAMEQQQQEFLMNQLPFLQQRMKSPLLQPPGMDQYPQQGRY